ncbi:hypothetical protein OF001_U180100 [Pseudomonas sp. OF001]|nr:hypothetical protein OF001_U180100 [Pseudomonas sp. OF001]
MGHDERWTSLACPPFVVSGPRSGAAGLLAAPATRQPAHPRTRLETSLPGDRRHEQESRNPQGRPQEAAEERPGKTPGQARQEVRRHPAGQPRGALSHAMPRRRTPGPLACAPRSGRLDGQSLEESPWPEPLPVTSWFPAKPSALN